MRRLFLIILGAVLALPLTAQQLPSLVFSGGKNFIGKDVLQLEYGFSFQREIKRLSSINQQISQYGLVKYGISSGVDLSISYNTSTIQTLVSDQVRRSNGLSNFTAGIKKKLGKNYSLQSTAGFSRNDVGGVDGSFQVFGISEHNLSSFLAWENNLGLAWSFGSPQANLQYLSGLTFTIPYPLDFIIEYYGQAGRDNWNNYANIGLGYYFNADLMMEAYVGYGNTLNQESTFFSVNFYWRLVPARYYEDKK